MRGEPKGIMKVDDAGRFVLETVKPKPPYNVNVPHGSKDQEIENLKRLLASVSQRLDALKTR